MTRENRIINCGQCGKETVNLKFCSSSCSAKYNNVHYPKREPTKRCGCGKAIARHVERCRRCYTENLKGNGPWFCFCGREISKNQKKCNDCKLIAAKENIERQSTGETKLCTICSKIKTTGNFFEGQNRCKKCCSNLTKSRRRLVKEKCVEYKGGKCERCGYDKCISALEFHHKDPTKKDFEISKYRMVMDECLTSELDKCELLCANCHRELHEGLENTSSRT